MTEYTSGGYKFLWVATDGVLEMHGKEKLHWTNLNEHIFRNNVPAEELVFKQSRFINIVQDGHALADYQALGIGNRLS